MKRFSPKLATKALWQLRVRKRPYVLSHGITGRCNMRCRFCEYGTLPGKEMSTPEIFSMLDDARSFGIGVYNAWTAEPLLRPDLPDILRYAKRLGLITSLVTNGKLLASRISDLNDLDYLSVSVEGIDSYQELRGMNVQIVLEGIKAAKAAGHQILMNCVISQNNLHELDDLVRLAGELGVYISFEPINENPQIAREVWDDLGIKDVPRYEKAVQSLIDQKRAGAPIINSETYLKIIKSFKPNIHCHASEIILHVASDGTIENCRTIKEPLGTISEGISQVWSSSKEKRKRIVEDCSGCLFFGYAENSLLYDMVPEVIAHYQWM